MAKIWRAFALTDALANLLKETWRFYLKQAVACRMNLSNGNRTYHGGTLQESAMFYDTITIKPMRKFYGKYAAKT